MPTPTTKTLRLKGLSSIPARVSLANRAAAGQRQAPETGEDVFGHGYRVASGAFINNGAFCQMDWRKVPARSRCAALADSFGGASPGTQRNQKNSSSCRLRLRYSPGGRPVHFLNAR